MQTSSRRRPRTFAVSALLLLALVPADASARSVDLVRIPDRWRVSSYEPYPGVEVLRLTRKNQAVSVVAIAPDAQVRVEHVLANEQLDARNPTQRPRRICRRLGCIAAINGAFFDRGSGLPFSGIISSGELIRSVTSGRPHVSIEDGIGHDQTTPPVQLVAYEQAPLDPLGAPAETRITMRGVNRPRGKHGIVVYTRRWGPTPPGRYGRELLLRAVGDPRLTIGTQSVFEVVTMRKAGGFLRPDEIVISATGSGAEQLAALWKTMRNGQTNRVVALDVATGPLTLIGTRPILIRDGRVLQRSSSFFANTRHPRSILAAKPDGTILFVVIDGRSKERRGMSLTDAAWFVKSLGASDAANLDGGGSSALVVDGRLHSRPSGYERRVATALVALPAR